VSWNVRGLNSGEKRKFMKSLILNWNADIVCLQESKLEGEVKDMIKELWGARWVKYACLQASGTRGGHSDDVHHGEGKFWKLAHTLLPAKLMVCL